MKSSTTCPMMSASLYAAMIATTGRRVTVVRARTSAARARRGCRLLGLGLDRAERGQAVVQRRLGGEQSAAWRPVHDVRGTQRRGERPLWRRVTHHPENLHRAQVGRDDLV